MKRCLLTKKYTDIPYSKEEEEDYESYISTAPRASFYPNSFGIYNMCGNVAEMIEEKGIAKGGSFNDLAYKVKISSERCCTKPKCDIGFRVEMKIIEF